MKKICLIFMSLMLVVLTGCSTDITENLNISESFPSYSENANGILSDFSTTDISGAEVDEAVLADYDLTMVNVWATFCGPCIREMPDLGELAEEYKENNVQIIGIVSDVLNSDGTISQNQVNTAQEIVSKTNADYLHLMPSNDLNSILAQISSVPTTFFVDKYGNQVGNAYVGSRSKDSWKVIIDETLAEVSQ